MKCCSVPVTCPECTATWWLWSPGLHCGPSDVGTPLLQPHIASGALTLHSCPPVSSHLYPEGTFLPPRNCGPLLVHLWSRKPSKLFRYPVGYGHNLCKEVKLQPWRWAPSEFVLPSVHFLSLRYALDFSLHLYNYSYQSFSSVVAQSCPTLCNPMNCSTPDLPVHHQLLEFTETHVHRVSPTISSSVIPFSSRLQSFPAWGSFPISQFFASGGQNIGVSALASVLPMNIQDWFPLGLTGSIALQSKGLSRVFLNTTVQEHQFFGTQLSL